MSLAATECLTNRRRRSAQRAAGHGELRTGQFVSQRELADLLGATLNPVREAIRKLEAEGLINVYAQRGIQIIEGGPKAINDSL